MPELTKQDIKEVFVETLEPFAKGIQEDFQKIDGRLDKMDGKIDKVDGKIDKMLFSGREVRPPKYWRFGNFPEVEPPYINTKTK